MDKKLTRRDLLIFYLRWWNWNQQCYNYERLQALGLTFSLIPIIKKLYDSTQDRIAALKRHLVFFNTEPFHAGIVIHGMVAALEEQKAAGADVSDDDINSLKIGLMGPLAGIGDSWFQGLVFPILLSLGSSMAIEGNFAGPFIWIVLFLAQAFLIGWPVFMMGYNQGKAAVSTILGSDRFKKAMEAMAVLGLMVVGAMGAQRVGLALNIQFAIGQSPINIQAILDGLVPSLVPLLVILGVYQMIRRKVSPLIVVIILFALGILGSLLGFLAIPGAG
jgi:PTS system mannose-specific IID component